MKVMCNRIRTNITILLVFVLLLAPTPTFASETLVKPVYALSNFSGRVPYNHVRLAVDRANGEVLVLDPRDGDIRVYNSTGMEVFRTIKYNHLGIPVDLAVEPDGTIDLLVINQNSYSLHRCDYRGEPVEEIPLADIPERFLNMRPNRIHWRNGLLYLVDMDSLRVILFDSSGGFVRGYDIADVLELDEKEAHESSIFGFTVGPDGDMLFTIPVSFSAYRMTLDGEVTRFGEPGSAPGQFAVVSGVAVDDNGNIFLSDRRRSVVMIYSPKLSFRGEFGYRGIGPGNLIVPDDLVLDGTGKVYVAQMRKRGVQVYRVALAE
jgi:DNA-binding beta-propeller fold protein YncE